MSKRKWWRFLLPVLVVVNAVVVLLIIGSAKPESKPVVLEAKTEFRSPAMPDSVEFAGEWMPLNRFDVKESLDRELLSNAYFHSQTIRFIKMAPRYFSIIEPILKEKSIPDDFKYLAVAESGLDPRAVSPAKAVGFWQFMKGTALQYGLEVNNEIDERYHLEKSTYAACDYLQDSFEKYGNWTLVAASYNAGMRGVDRQLERQKTDSYYNLLLVEETGRYLFRIVALKLILENPKQYNFIIPQEEKYPIIKTRDVEIAGSVDNFADFANEQGITYKLLKDFNPWLRESYLKNPSRKKYIIDIPILN
jgi:membrane-bound lytic murein transglycosylase D